MATDATSLVSRINVVYLYVRNMKTSLAFYRDLLGVPLEGDDMWAEATFRDGVRFALHGVSDDAAELSSGTVHVDFEVADADAAAAELRAAGVEVRETMRDEFGTALEVVDPDGYRIYLFEPPG